MGVAWFDRTRWAQVFEVPTSCVPQVYGFDQCGIGVANFTVGLAVFECRVQFKWRCEAWTVTKCEAGHFAYGAVDEHATGIAKRINAATGYRDFGSVISGAAVVIYAKGEDVTAVVNEAGDGAVGCPYTGDEVICANVFGLRAQCSNGMAGVNTAHNIGTSPEGVGNCAVCAGCGEGVKEVCATVVE